MTVAAVLDLFQTTRGAPVARRDVEAIASADVRAAFEACNVLVNARTAETMPCRERAGCAREVRDTGEIGPKRYVAVCGQSPPECDPLVVSVEALARVQLSIAGLTSLLRRLFAIGGTAPSLPARVGSEPIALGAQDRRAFGHGARDAFLALDPASDAFAPWLALRGRATRGAVVFVASSRGLAADLVGRYAVGDRSRTSDLGMANLKNRASTATWKLLVLMCEGEGKFDWKAIAPSRETTRKHVSNLRKAMQALFGLADDPFVEHEGDYRPRFRARVGLPGEAGKA